MGVVVASLEFPLPLGGVEAALAPPDAVSTSVENNTPSARGEFVCIMRLRRSKAARRFLLRTMRAPTKEWSMFEWPEEMQMIRDAVRQFVDNEVRPHREELEHGDLPPYDLLRKLYSTFGMDAMARDSF